MTRSLGGLILAQPVGWVLGAFALLTFGIQARAGDSAKASPAYTVIHVVDGDTVVLRIDGQVTTVRLGDVPADAKKAGGAVLKGLLASETVRFAPSGGKDKNGHPIGKLFKASDNTLLNGLVAKGVAQAAPKAKDADERKQAQKAQPPRRRPLRLIRNNPDLNRAFDVPADAADQMRQGFNNALANQGMGFGVANQAAAPLPWMNMPGFGWGAPGLGMGGFGFGGFGFPWLFNPYLAYGSAVAYAYPPGFYLGGFGYGSGYLNNNSLTNQNSQSGQTTPSRPKQHRQPTFTLHPSYPTTSGNVSGFGNHTIYAGVWGAGYSVQAHLPPGQAGRASRGSTLEITDPGTDR